MFEGTYRYFTQRGDATLDADPEADQQGLLALWQRYSDDRRPVVGAEPARIELLGERSEQNPEPNGPGWLGESRMQRRQPATQPSAAHEERRDGGVVRNPAHKDEAH